MEYKFGCASDSLTNSITFVSNADCDELESQECRNNV